MDLRPLQRRKRKIREDKKPACDACRAQKLRCDASLDYSRPCTRCHRKEILCVVEEHRRKKGCTEHDLGTSSQIDATSKTHPFSAPTAVNLPLTGEFQSQSVTVGDDRSSDDPPISAHASASLGTKSRIIDGIQIDSSKIDICFSRFFLYFAPLLPILSEESTPNQTFRESPLKFWVITTIGSKNCLDDPTLFSTLSPRVEALALQSLYIRRLSAYPIVEAYLLMCNFQLSTDRPSWRSVYFALSSAVIPITMQAGMHRCSNVPGFFSSLATPETVRGAKLWAYAVVLNQTTTALQGFTITNASALHHVSLELDCCTSLPGWLRFECRISAHLASFHQLVEDFDLTNHPGALNRWLRNRILASDSELLVLQNAVRLQDQGPFSNFCLSLCRLQICTFAFHMNELWHTDTMRMAEAAIVTIDIVCDLDKTHKLSLACPDFVLQGMQLAACTLLKLLKTYPEGIGTMKDEMISALFSAINIFKSISAANNDIPAKVAEILGRLWSARNIYRDADGEIVSRLMVQNRLSMSVVFDCLYWWRKLFTDPSKEASHEQDLGSSNLLPPDHTTGEFPGSSPAMYNDWDIWGFDWDLSGPLQIPTDSSLGNSF